MVYFSLFYNTDAVIEVAGKDYVDIPTVTLQLLQALPLSHNKTTQKGCNPKIYSQWIAKEMLPKLMSNPNPNPTTTTTVTNKNDLLLCSVIKWCILRAKKLEQFDHAPHRALLIANIVSATESITTSVPPITFPFHALSSIRDNLLSIRIAGSIQDHFDNLITLRKRLNELVHLHDAHPQFNRMELSLEQYENEVDQGKINKQTE